MFIPKTKEQQFYLSRNKFKVYLEILELRFSWAGNSGSLDLYVNNFLGVVHICGIFFYCWPGKINFFLLEPTLKSASMFYFNEVPFIFMNLPGC